MTYPNLPTFLDELRRRDDLVEITAPVDPKLEIAEIHRRVIAAGGPALLFRNVKGSSFPVVTNLFGTRGRVELAFGERPKQFIETAASLPDELFPPSLKKLWGYRGVARDLLRVGLKGDRNPPVTQHTIPEADLTQLPALTSWKDDGGPFLTLPLVHTPGTEGPDNLGIYRMQIFEPGEAGMHFQIGKGGGFHLYEAEQAGRPLPAHVYLGGPPALILSAIAPLPENVPELILASLVLGKRLGKCDLPGDTLPGVAEAEFCITGHVPPKVRRPEGPFGDHYGYYSLTHDYPVFRPKTIYHRKNAVFPATVVGKPRQEDFFLGDYLQELLGPILPKAMPAVRDIWSYGETGYHSLAAAQLKERYGRESMTSVFRILGEGQLSLTKFLLAVDRPVDLHDFRAVLTHVLERVDWRTGLYVFSELSMDSLDYTGPEINKGSKGVILGTGEPIRRLEAEWSGEAPGPVRNVKVFSPGCLVIEVPGFKEDQKCVEALPRDPAFANWPLLVAVDDAEKASRSVASFLWTTFTRFEPGADIHAAETRTVRHKLCYEGPVLIDARFKPWYPEELFCDEETSKQVTRRWNEYFGSRKVEMGDSDFGHLYT